MGRIRNRKELRAEHDAAERRKAEEGEVDEAEDELDEDSEEEDESEAGEEEEGGDEEDEEAAPKAKKKAAKPKTKAKAKPRSRAAKITRMKVVWGVFNNSNQRVAVFEYPKRKDADDLAAKLMTDKKTTHFVQPVKEPIEEKKEA